MQEESEIWDKKKIILGLISGAILIGGAVYLLKPTIAKNIGKTSSSSPQVAGVETKSSDQNASQNPNQTKEELSLPKNATELEKRLEIIKREVITLTTSDIASSSPQLLQVVQDIKNLQQSPANATKQLCENICKSL